MRYIDVLFLLLLTLASLPASGQEPVVSNVTLSQSASGSGTQVDIYYDLSSPGGSCTVAAYLSRDAGTTFPSPIVSATDDIGSNVSPGVGKHIAWNIAADCPNETIAQACIRIVADLSPPDPTYAVGTHDITYTDPSRGNRSVINRIRYPATWSGADAPLAGGPGVRFPVVVFGHGWLTPTSSYAYIWNSLAPAGYIVVMVDTEGDAAPDQDQFARDMAFVVDSFQQENANPASFFYGKVAPASAAAGHSMGGGASIVSVQYSANIDTVVNLAAAQNSAPVIEDAALVTQPALMISGASDCVAPPSDHQIPMYQAMPSICKYFVSIVQGSHCQFCQNNSTCTTAQSVLCFGRQYVAQGTQQMLTTSIMINWLDAKLKGRQSRWLQFDPNLNTFVRSNLITYNSSCNAPVVGQSAVGLLETVPPSVISFAVEGPRSAMVTFSEAMFWPSTGTPANYTLTGAIGTLSANPAGIESVGGNGYRLNWASGEMLNGGGVALSVVGVQDARGNPIAVPNSASSVGAGVPPTAVLSVAPTVDETSPPAAYDFTIIYQDNTAVKASTLDGGDIRVTGPNGFDALAAFVSVDPATGDGSPLTATYRIVPPGGTWDSGDNGLYMIAQDIGQVTDTAGNAAPAGQLGSFLVDFSLTVTVQSNPAGCSFTVDGTTYTSAQTFSWIKTNWARRIPGRSISSWFWL